jgi:23S rRNA pseudouridine1911/1915/1917 synthase
MHHSSAPADGLEDDDDDAGASVRSARQTFLVDASLAGERLDKALAAWLPALSRSRLKQWIEVGAVSIEGRAVKPRHALVQGELVEVIAQPAPEASAFVAEPIPLSIVHEDASLIVIDKPPGLVVHPAAGHWSGTLLNGLLAYAPELTCLPRAGIVHRLDAETSGLLVVARTLEAQTDLVRQLQERRVVREYWALVLGATPASGTIDVPIGRDRRDPRRFRAGDGTSAKPARTHYTRVAAGMTDKVTVSWLACRLETGRTHQIRVHLEHIGHPLLGDPVYRRGLPARDPEKAWTRFGRQALHARRLGLVHPSTRKHMEWQRPPPQDMLELMSSLGLRQGTNSHDED